MKTAVLENWRDLIVQSFHEEKRSILDTKSRLLEAGCPPFQERRLRAYLRELGLYEIRGRGKHTQRAVTCDSCGNDFTASASHARYCKTCVPDVAARNRMSSYGISQPTYEKLLLSQGHRCAVCQCDLQSKKTAHVHIDHDHHNGVIRGVLCANCNYAVGLIESDWWCNIFKQANEYLKRCKENRF